MKIIEFKEDQKEEWNRFIAENCSESFLQSWEWGEFQKSIGREVYRIGFEENNEIIVIALLIKYNLPFGKSYLYCPRGPVINESRIKYLAYQQAGQESRILDFVFDEIKKIAKEEKSLFLRIDPPIEQNSESGTVNQEYINLFRKSNFEIQPKNTLILDLEKSEEDLLKEMKQKTRYNIRLAKRKEVRIRKYEPVNTNQKLFRKKFEVFWSLVEETSRRDKFTSHDKNYYWKMIESLSFHSEYIKQVQNNSQNLRAILYFAEHNNKIIAANLVLFFGDIVIYLHGASSSEYRNLMAPYLLQWQQIIDAKEAGCKKYDFWGITVNREKKSWQGITKFKKGFGGNEKRYIGAYELIFSNIGYAIYKSIRKIKNVLKFVK